MRPVRLRHSFQEEKSLCRLSVINGASVPRSSPELHRFQNRAAWFDSVHLSGVLQWVTSNTLCARSSMMQATPGSIQLASDLWRNLIVILNFDQLPQSLFVFLADFMLIPAR